MAKHPLKFTIAALALWPCLLAAMPAAGAEEMLSDQAPTDLPAGSLWAPPPVPPEAAYIQVAPAEAAPPMYAAEPPPLDPGREAVVWDGHGACDPCHDYDESWYLQLLPQSILYKAYLANVKESRLNWRFSYAFDHGWFFDGTLGGRFGLLRYGTGHAIRPKGFQIDVEASAQVRLDPTDEVDVRAVDFRAGLPFTIGYGEYGQYQTKLAYYHLSSHLGDEFLLKRPGFPRVNYVRDEIVLGHSVYLNENLRVYAEIGYAFNFEVAEPWEAQFGIDYAPAYRTGWRGAPFWALNTHLRQEVEWGGNFTVQVGWAWRSDESARLLRVGLHYYNGENSQYSLFDEYEHVIGAGVWYDF